MSFNYKCSWLYSTELYLGSVNVTRSTKTKKNILNSLSAGSNVLYPWRGLLVYCMVNDSKAKFSRKQ